MLKLIAMMMVLHGSTVHLTDSSCDLVVSPPVVLVLFEGSFSVNCSSPTQTNLKWEIPIGAVNEKGEKYVIWSVSTIKEWSISPICYSINNDKCTSKPSIIVYKMPTSVNLSIHATTMKEGLPYELQCDITDIAPVGNFTVLWFKGNDLIWSESFHDPTKEPMNKTSNYTFIAHRVDNEAVVFCKAHLNLETHTDNVSVMHTSEKYKLTVLYPPTFLNPKPETVDLAMGDGISLNCTAMGNPRPSYSWHSSETETQAVVRHSLLHPGNYTCTASNIIGHTTKHFIVIDTRRFSTFWAILGPGVVLAILLTAITFYRTIKHNGR